MMIDNKKVLPILPVVSTDSNLRSHKEKTHDGWKTQYNDQNLSKIISIAIFAAKVSACIFL